MSDLVCIKTYLNPYEAELAKRLLESNGIEAEVILFSDVKWDCFKKEEVM